MDVLCFDIGSGGITAACFNERLETTAIAEVPWQFQHDAAGGSTLLAEDITGAVEQLAPLVTQDRSPAAVCAGCFMHSYLVLSSCCAPLTAISTWMDTTGAAGIAPIRKLLGDRLHLETGCRYHPMFPVFKLAANPAGRGNRVASPKAFLIQELTNVFIDDVGTASASGLLELHSSRWHPEILDALGLVTADLPALANPYDIAGNVTPAAADRFGVPSGTPVVPGSGDGFLANVGSGCTTPDRVAVTLGTSGVVRQSLPVPVVDEHAGTFCYRASTDAFLLGCASNNGGNVLDWARRVFGPIGESDTDVPVLLPWFYGERSFEWDSRLEASLHDLKANHDAAAMARAAIEGVLFNLAHYVERIRGLSPAPVRDVILSGNGFLDPKLPSMMATLLGCEILLPADSGLASLRGAAVHAWRAIGHDASPHIEAILQRAERVPPGQNSAMRERFARFKELRRSRSIAPRRGDL